MPSGTDTSGKIRSLERRLRIGILATHPIQYQSPWFQAIAAEPALDPLIMYCCKPDAHQQASGFHVDFEWDIPLLEGFPYCFLPNVSRKPNTDTFSGMKLRCASALIIPRSFDAVLVNGWYYGAAWQTILACRRNHIPVMVRGDSTLNDPRPLAWKVAKKVPYRAMFKLFDACLPCGVLSHNYFEHYGVRSDRLFTVPNVVDVKRIQLSSAAWALESADLRKRWGLSTGTVTFVFIGKLISEKHPLQLIEAAAIATRLGAKLQLLIVGEGPLRSRCQALAQSLSVPCHFAGFLNQSEICAAYVVSDVLVMPGRVSWGLAVNEAIAVGRLCIVSDGVGCHPDLVLRDLTGFVFRCGNVEELADYMQLCASDPNRVREMGMNAQELSERYTPSKAALAVTHAALAVTRSMSRGGHGR